MITSDDRVAELIEEVAKSQVNKTSNPGYFDLVVTPLATGSIEYINWVKQQTMKISDIPTFYNEQVTTTVKALTKTVEETKKEEATEKPKIEAAPEKKVKLEKKTAPKPAEAQKTLVQ